MATDNNRRRSGPPRPAGPQGRPQASRRPSTGRSSDAEGSWDHVASWYDSLVGERGSDFHQSVIVPGLLRLLDLKRGERILDVACGQGAVSFSLHQAGALVTGVDLSPQLIARAKERAPEGLRFLVGDARRLDALNAGSFDAAVCVLAAQNIDPLEPVIREMGRVLAIGGRVVLVVPHPAFRIPRQSGWQWDEDRKLLYRQVDRYLTELKIPIDMRPFRQPTKQVTWTYHRPVSVYVNGLAEAGLLTNAMEEWTSHRVSQPGPRASAENRARADFPLFLALRAIRVSQ